MKSLDETKKEKTKKEKWRKAKAKAKKLTDQQKAAAKPVTL